MKLLSIAIPHHDVNISYFDGTRLWYHKIERTKQSKRYKFDSLLDWKQEVESLWGVSLSDVDDVILSFDVNQLPNTLRGDFFNNVNTKIICGTELIIPIDSKVCNFLGVKHAWYINHHYAHALSTWMLENKEPNLRVVVDGLGNGRTWSIFKDDRIISYGDVNNGSIGWGMREIGKLLNVQYGHYNDIAGKVMGIQSYGNLDIDFLVLLQKYNINHIKDIFSFSTWVSYKQDELIASNTLLDWAKTVHKRIEQLLVELFAMHASEEDYISYSGGVAQNVIWNTELKKIFKNLIIPPHSSDEGLSLGAMEWLRKKYKLPKLFLPSFPYSQSDKSPENTPSENTIKLAAKFLAEGKVIGWYQGNGEVGPRALGNRSILFDPRISNGKQIVNRVKKRENYRPFGASVLQENKSDYFSGSDDAYMLFTTKNNTNSLPSITHVDGTCRVQTVDKTNGYFRLLLEEFFKLTGCPVLLNTSLNLAGKPIAGYPDNALQFFYESEIDCMFIGDDFFIKTFGDK
jgi:carbamoyltransferase